MSRDVCCKGGTHDLIQHKTRVKTIKLYGNLLLLGIQEIYDKGSILVVQRRFLQWEVCFTNSREGPDKTNFSTSSQALDVEEISNNSLVLWGCVWFPNPLCSMMILHSLQLSRIIFHAEISNVSLT